VQTAIEFRALDRSDLSRLSDIDRTERIEVLYVQEGTELVARHGEWNATAWDGDSQHDHSVEAKVREAEQYLDVGGHAFGAFAHDRMIGIGIVVPHLRPGIAQLAFLHVSAPWRSAGIGARLCERLDEVARSAGASEMVVSATPSGDTVRFYRGRGFTPTADPVPELFRLEPEDVHMHKGL
jgi:GNAT superfamily N-acetyltransferase